MDEEIEVYTCGVSGFIVLHNFLTIEEEQQCIDEVLDKPLSLTRSGTRRFQSYVPWEEKSGKRVPKKDFDTLPDYAHRVIIKILKALNSSLPSNDWSKYEPMKEDINTELQVNEYTEDSYIPFHFDDIHAYKSIIFGVSLGAGWLVKFSLKI